MRSASNLTLHLAAVSFAKAQRIYVHSKEVLAMFVTILQTKGDGIDGT